jgi:hypothetical protein
MTKTSDEYVIKFLTRERNGPKNIHQRMINVHGEDAPSYFTINFGPNNFDEIGNHFRIN